MSEEKDSLKPPKPMLVDAAYAVARAGMGSIPTVGSAATELFQLVFAPPLEKRRQEWMETVAEAIRRLEEQDRIKIEELKDNDAFLDTVMQASQISQRNSQREKLEALRNAVTNSALSQSIDTSRQQMFLNLVDMFTIWHIRILKLFFDLRKWYEAHNRKPPQLMMGALHQILTNVYPELDYQREFYDQIAKELFERGLLNTNGLHTMMTGDGTLEKRCTELGKQFISFITDPNGT